MEQLPTYDEFLNESMKYSKINIFDVDDTLVVTDSKIKVTDKDRKSVV